MARRYKRGDPWAMVGWRSVARSPGAKRHELSRGAEPAPACVPRSRPLAVGPRRGGIPATLGGPSGRRLCAPVTRKCGQDYRNRNDSATHSPGTPLAAALQRGYNRLVSEDHAMQGAEDRVRMTYEDLLALPDDGMRHELIDGEHFVTPAPSWPHQIIVGNLHRLIANHVHAHHLGVIFVAPLDVVFTKHDVVEPDVLFFTPEGFKAHVGKRNAEGPPDLAVEVLSPSTRRRDEMIKRRLYERMGVGEYLDRRSRDRCGEGLSLERRQVRANRAETGGWRRPHVLPVSRPAVATEDRIRDAVTLRPPRDELPPAERWSAGDRCLVQP